MRKHLIVMMFVTAMILTACGANGTNAPVTQVNPDLQNVLPPDVALNVQNQISQTLGVTVENIKITQVEQKDWPDACLGLPQGNEVCAQTVTPGWLLTFNINGQVYKYRVDKTGKIIRQEP